MTKKKQSSGGFETAALGIAKAIAFLIFWITAAAVLVRGVVGPLWGSGSDFGLLGAVAAGALGIIGLAWLGLRLASNIINHFKG